MTKLVNRAKMTTATTGTGTITLSSAESGYQSFADAGVVDADVVRYVIEDGTDWEIGTGTYTATGTTLTRTVSESSNADAAINLTGSAVVYVSAAAADIFQGELFAENPSSPTAPSAGGTNSVAIGSGSDVAAAATGGFAAGHLADVNNQYAIAGPYARGYGNYGVAFGYEAQSSAQHAVAVGANSGSNGARSLGSASIALGGSYASGADSFAAAIANNTSSYGATGANSVAMGDRAKASGTRSLAIGGFGAIASGLEAIAIGYQANASEEASLALGQASVSNSRFGVAIGQASTQGVRYRHAYGGNRFSSTGDCQAGLFILKVATTDATPSGLSTDTLTPSAINQIILPNNSAYFFSGTIIARQDAASGTDMGAWEIKGAIRREGSAATTTLVKSTIDEFSAPTNWTVALSADTTNGGLKIEVTGVAATNIRWVATVHTSEVTY